MNTKRRERVQKGGNRHSGKGLYKTEEIYYYFFLTTRKEERRLSCGTEWVHTYINNMRERRLRRRKGTFLHHTHVHFFGGLSQPFSLIMCAISIMYLPSLYFWLDSNACSYFQPRVVLQHSQYISATACSPVNSILSSAGPHPTFTTELKRYALPWLPWNDLDMSSSWLARCALQCMQE